MLSKWPLPQPREWINFVNEPASEKELDALRRSCVRGTSYGDDDWMKETARTDVAMPGFQQVADAVFVVRPRDKSCRGLRSNSGQLPLSINRFLDVERCQPKLLISLPRSLWGVYSRP